MTTFQLTGWRRFLVGRSGEWWSHSRSSCPGDTQWSRSWPCPGSSTLGHTPGIPKLHSRACRSLSHTLSVPRNHWERSNLGNKETALCKTVTLTLNSQVCSSMSHSLHYWTIVTWEIDNETALQAFRCLIAGHSNQGNRPDSIITGILTNDKTALPQAF